MSLIKNLCKETERRPQKSNKKGKGNDEDKEEPKVRPIIKSATDLQRLKVEKLMKNPEKPVIIPEQRREKDHLQTVPSFVRNVMGSSAGAGSGEFHVYRHLRRKEYARQKTIQAKSTKEKLDDDYQEKLEENRRIAEEKTAKKRAKRLKRKQRAKQPRQSHSNDTKRDHSESHSSHDSDEASDIGIDCTKSEEKEETDGVAVVVSNEENDVAAAKKEQSTLDKDTEDDTVTVVHIKRTEEGHETQGELSEM